MTADAQSRTYGDPNPSLTYTIGGPGLVNNDALRGALSTSATTASNIGAYSIGQNTLAASSNYALSYTGADLSVIGKPVTVAANPRGEAYSFVEGKRDNMAASIVGQNTVNYSGNYAFTHRFADFSVLPRATNIPASPRSLGYGGSLDNKPSSAASNIGGPINAGSGADSEVAAPEIIVPKAYSGKNTLDLSAGIFEGTLTEFINSVYVLPDSPIAHAFADVGAIDSANCLCATSSSEALSGNDNYPPATARALSNFKNISPRQMPVTDQNYMPLPSVNLAAVGFL